MNTSPTFKVSSYGIVRLPVWGNSLVLQSDGKIVVGGGPDFSLVRLNADTSQDTSFSNDGMATFAAGQVYGQNSLGNSVLVQPDGKLIISGNVFFNNGDRSDFAVIRVNADGSLDKSFSGDGKAIIAVGVGSDYATSIALQPDGKILIAGESANGSGSHTNFSVVRLNADGTLDKTFGGDGKALLPLGFFHGRAYSVAVQGDGKVVLAGETTTEDGVNAFGIIRLNADGSLDAGFDGDGKVIMHLANTWDTANTVVMQPDGKIVVGGITSTTSGLSSSLVRLNTNGSLDMSFGANGKVIVDSGASFIIHTNVTLQPDGKIVLAGTSVGSFEDELRLARLNVDGSLDTGFSGDGRATISTGGDYNSSVMTLPDGKILLGGSSGVMRLNADGSLDSTFHPTVTDGTARTIVYNYVDTRPGDNLAIFDAELAALNGGAGNYAGASVTLSREGGPDARDVFSPAAFLSFSGGIVQLYDKTVGTVDNGGGVLTIHFNDHATQMAVSTVLSNIIYTNSNIFQTQDVHLVWIFNDGNSGSQGTGGALTAIGRTTVQFETHKHHYPEGEVTIIGDAAPGHVLHAINTLSDQDGLGAISYQWQVGGDDISGAIGDSYQVSSTDEGKFISVVASYTDGLGGPEHVASTGVPKAYFALSENSTEVTTIVPRDFLLGAHSKFDLSGDDAGLFKIDSNGKLSFVVAPDYELRNDVGGDGVYHLILTMSNAKTKYTVTKELYIGVDFVAVKGTPASDVLRGTNGSDTFDGLTGNDKLTGKNGLDTFHIGQGSDTISDFNLLGDDLGQEVLQVEAGATVVATLASKAWLASADSYNWGVAELRTKGLDVDLSDIVSGLGWSVVNTGKDATITGSKFADVLSAGAGADTLNGGDGNDLLIGNKLADTLTGGAGADHFRLNGIKGASTAHIITDFVSGEDRIELDVKVFKALGLGQLADSAFVLGTAAQTADQHLIYDRGTGHLLYDADGSGKKVAVLVGVLNHDTALNVADLWGV